MQRNTHFLFFLITLFHLTACGQNRNQAHRQLTQKEKDSLRVTDSIRNLQAQMMKRMAHPETDSLRVLDLSSNFDPSNINNYVYPRVRIQNETYSVTWKYKEIIFHIYINGKEIQSTPAQPEGHIGPNLSGVVPPNTTITFRAVNPIDDGQGIPTSGNSPGSRWYNSGMGCKVEIIYDYPKPLTEVLTLTGVSDRSMKSAGTFNFTNNKADTVFYCESMDSCIVDGKAVALYPQEWQPSVKPEFANKKFKVTYTVDNSGGNNTDGNKQVIYMNVTKMVLVK